LQWGAASFVYFACVPPSVAQETSPAPASAQQSAKPANAAAAAPLRLTLQDALDRARKNSVQFQAAVTMPDSPGKIAGRLFDALLPGVTYNNSAIYTQGAGPVAAAATGVPVVFIANNAVHEYLSQETCMRQLTSRRWQIFARCPRSGGRQVAGGDCFARPGSDGDARILRSGGGAAKGGNGEKGARMRETGFSRLPQDLEQGGEVAHADVIKAELQMRERQRALQEAQLGFLNARLNFGVLIFSNFEDNFEVADDLHAAVALPTLAEVQERAARDNPDLRAALAFVQESNHGVFGARAAYLPSLTLDYFYGIDATRFATHSVFKGQKFSNLVPP